MKREKSPTTAVLFRMAKEEGEEYLTAVFPEIPGSPGNMSCFEHVGQHSSCSMEWYQTTWPALPEQYAELKAELEAKPYEYELNVVQRITSKHRETRLKRERN